MKKILFLGALTLVLVGCGENVKTVEYWNDHQDERKEFLKQCRNGGYDKNPKSCENARTSAGPKAAFFGGINRFLFGDD